MGKLLDDVRLAQSPVVANCMMNRERVCTGGNSYAKELGLNPLDFLRSRLETQKRVAWLDLCCGRGRALIEAGQHLAGLAAGREIVLIGIDLVPMFDPCPDELHFVRFVEASAVGWEPECAFDLITCVHGLHYVGDKLGLVQRACSWLKPDGRFIANLDWDNLKGSGEAATARKLLRKLRRAGLCYDTRKHLLSCLGNKRIRLDYEYLGADEGAGPNYTGQAAIHSYYRPATGES